MQTIYFDHSVVANEQNWPAIQKILNSQEERIVVSEWELLEIAQGADQKQALRRVDFIMSLNPLWIVGRLHIQRIEVENFIRENFWLVPSRDFSPLTPVFSVVLSYDSGSIVPIGATAKDYVIDLLSKPELRRNINNGKTVTANSQATLQQAGKQKRKNAEKVIFSHWVNRKLPAVHHDGHCLTKTGIQELIEYCWNNQPLFYAKCPAMAVESAITEIRALDPNRRPQTQDSVDLQHAIIALSCCDVFVTRDRYLKDCSTKIKQRLSNNKIAHTLTLSEAVDTNFPL